MAPGSKLFAYLLLCEAMMTTSSDALVIADSQATICNNVFVDFNPDGGLISIGAGKACYLCLSDYIQMYVSLYKYIHTCTQITFHLLTC